jgi:hypothetical protein
MHERRVQAPPLQEHQVHALLHCVPLPLHSDLRAEVAGVWVKAGMLGQAMAEYEALQRWQPLAECYAAAGKAAAAESVLRQQLQAQPRNPALLCALGSLLQQDVWLERAWESSGHTHAQRCVAQVGACMRVPEWPPRMLSNRGARVQPEAAGACGACAARVATRSRALCSGAGPQPTGRRGVV